MSEEVRSNLRPGDQKELDSPTLPYPGKLESSCNTGSVTSLDSQVSIVITTPSSPGRDGNPSDQAFVWPTECQNMLLDPGIVNDTQTQALLLTTLVSLLFTRLQRTKIWKMVIKFAEYTSRGTSHHRTQHKKENELTRLFISIVSLREASISSWIFIWWWERIETKTWKFPLKLSHSFSCRKFMIHFIPSQCRKLTLSL